MVAGRNNVFLKLGITIIYECVKNLTFINKKNMLQYSINLKRDDYHVNQY